MSATNSYEEGDAIRVILYKSLDGGTTWVPAHGEGEPKTEAELERMIWLGMTPGWAP